MQPSINHKRSSVLFRIKHYCGFIYYCICSFLDFRIMNASRAHKILELTLVKQSLVPQQPSRNCKRQHPDSLEKIDKKQIFQTAKKTKQKHEALHQHSRKPTKQTTEPNLHTTEPTLQTTEPNLPTTEPNLQTTEPNLQTTEPNLQTTEPNRQTTEPTLQTTEPTLQTTEPNLQTTEPNLQTTEPTLQTTELTLQTTELTLQTTEPTLQTTEPNLQTTEPNLQTTEPNLQTTEPTLQATEPTLQTTDISQQANSTGSFQILVESIHDNLVIENQPGGLPELSSSFKVIINEELGLTLDTDIAELLQCTSGTMQPYLELIVITHTSKYHQIHKLQKI